MLLTGDQHQTQGEDVMSIEEATVHGEASRFTAKAKGQTVKQQTKGIPVAPHSKDED